MAAQIIGIPYTELKAGNVVHFYGARFEIVSAELKEDSSEGNHGPIMKAEGKWLDGEIVSGYFGPDKNWNFQGNKLAQASIEA